MRALLCSSILLLSSGCGTVLMGVQKPIVLVDAPADLVVRDLRSGAELPITTVEAGGSRSAAQETATFYLARGVKLKPEKDLRLELRSGEQVVDVPVGKKNMVGVLIADVVFSWGLFAIIDLATGGCRKHRPTNLDVPALLAGTTPRTEEQLKWYIKGNAASVTYDKSGVK